MQREDLVVKFGGLRHPQSNLQALAAVVAENENVRLVWSITRCDNFLTVWCTRSQKVISVLVRRSGTEGPTALRLIPRQGWGGRGSLGYVLWIAHRQGALLLTLFIVVTSCRMRRRNIRQ